MRWLPLLLLGITGCAVGEDELCEHSSQCATGMLCRFGRCELLRPDPDSANANQHTDVGVASSEADLVEQPAVPHPCGSAARPFVADLRINEVYAHVANGQDGDANRDGERDAYDDEFVEIWNVSGKTLRVDGVSLYVGDTFRFAFDEALCLRPSQAVVVFSGGTPALATDIAALTSQSRLALSNQGGTASLKVGDMTLDTFEWPNGPALSWQRWPEDRPETVMTHDTCGANYSPGRCCDGSDFQTGCVTARSRD